jgi:hypothetical protein
MKTCTKCGETKVLVDFPPLKRSGDGRRSSCRVCTNAAHREYLTRPDAKAKKAKRDTDYYRDPIRHDAIIVQQRERYAKPEVKAAASERERKKRLDPDYREKKRVAAAEWYSKPENKAKAKSVNREYLLRPDRKEIDRERKAVWNKSASGRAYFARRQREVRATPDGAIANITRKLLYRVLDATTLPKNGKTIDLLGYSTAQLRDRIACQFRPGMSWANHGEWHIDHKKPVAEFIRRGVTDPSVINMLCNLQPLWAAENIIKRDKWPTSASANENKVTAIAA